jgi:hypothetical protein
MEYVFFFVSFWDFETAWYKKEFFYWQLIVPH